MIGLGLRLNHRPAPWPPSPSTSPVLLASSSAPGPEAELETLRPLMAPLQDPHCHPTSWGRNVPWEPTQAQVILEHATEIVRTPALLRGSLWHLRICLYLKQDALVLDRGSGHVLRVLEATSFADKDHTELRTPRAGSSSLHTAAVK